MKVLFSLLMLLASTAHASNEWYGNLFGFYEDIPSGVRLQKLVTLTNDKDNNAINLHLMLDKSDLVTGFYGQANENNIFAQANERGKNVFWLRDIESKEGVVLASRSGYDVLLMNGNLDRESQEGKFTIRYLSNGLSKRYESCDFFLRKAKNSWFIQNAYTKAKVTKVNVTSWSLGITTIEGICPKK